MKNIYEYAVIGGLVIGAFACSNIDLAKNFRENEKKARFILTELETKILKDNSDCDDDFSKKIKGGWFWMDYYIPSNIGTDANAIQRNIQKSIETQGLKSTISKNQHTTLEALNTLSAIAGLELYKDKGFFRRITNTCKYSISLTPDFINKLDKQNWNYKNFNINALIKSLEKIEKIEKKRQTELKLKIDNLIKEINKYTTLKFLGISIINYTNLISALNEIGLANPKNTDEIIKSLEYSLYILKLKSDKFENRKEMIIEAINKNSKEEKLLDLYINDDFFKNKVLDEYAIDDIQEANKETYREHFLNLYFTKYNLQNPKKLFGYNLRYKNKISTWKDIYFLAKLVDMSKISTSNTFKQLYKKLFTGCKDTFKTNSENIINRFFDQQTKKAFNKVNSAIYLDLDIKSLIKIAYNLYLKEQLYTFIKRFTVKLTSIHMYNRKNNFTEFYNILTTNQKDSLFDDELSVNDFVYTKISETYLGIKSDKIGLQDPCFKVSQYDSIFESFKNYINKEGIDKFLDYYKNKLDSEIKDIIKNKIPRDEIATFCNIQEKEAINIIAKDTLLKKQN